MRKILFRILEFLGCVVIAAIGSWPMGMAMSFLVLLMTVCCCPSAWGQKITEDDIFIIFWLSSGVFSILIGIYRAFQEFKE